MVFEERLERLATAGTRTDRGGTRTVAALDATSKRKTSVSRSPSAPLLFLPPLAQRRDIAHSLLSLTWRVAGMGRHVLFLFVVLLTSGRAFAVPDAVTWWQKSHPDATIIGWQLIRSDELGEGTYIIKTLEHGAVYVHDATFEDGTDVLSQIKNYHWNSCL
jgi:hypothetical protein